ncbi:MULTISPECIES: hypothetical protein [unclassified Anabaena]|uniref:hypothetical protein n=1 Tax=unclassified Anabaena TaxID=2619674 RepID=UPI0014459EA7|nr:MULTISPECIES: hypothetical protein [unclassified Anabaena]
MNNWLSINSTTHNPLSASNTVNNPLQLPVSPVNPGNLFPKVYVPIVPLPKY